MAWVSLSVLTSSLAIIVLVLLRRRHELDQLSGKISELSEAKKRGTHLARLQYPHIDLSRCLGCGTCIRACPEDGVLELIHGQAVVVHGARCVGHGLCARECPVGAIDLTLAEIETRRDLPVLDERLEAPQVPGLFLAGEVTGFALIRTAISHGVAITNEVARRPRATDGALDLCIVGAGPAGIAAALQAKKLGLDSVVLEREELGGTVSKYPRRKLVMTQPATLPLHGPMKRRSYAKEELLELWTRLAETHQLPIRTGQEFQGLERVGQDFEVRTQNDRLRARHVCLALGRRGTPRKLGVPGEDLSKVVYSLIDAASYTGRRVLVVGGGDSAIEAALGLAAQPGNEVTLSYRRAVFTRIKARNEARLDAARAQGAIRCLLESRVLAIRPDEVVLAVKEGEGKERLRLANDEVFIMAGGVPPFALLEAQGVSFDPEARPAPPPLAERGTGLLRAASAALFLALAVVVWGLVFRDYYALAGIERPASPWHDWLRPSAGFGLACGIAAAALVVVNLLYLARRRFDNLIPGSLTAWMSSHVVTGILAFLLVLVHAGLAPKDTSGGHAFAALAFLLVTGAIGRYLYSFVPRAANGEEVAIDELQDKVEAEAGRWEREGRAFKLEVREEVRTLVAEGRWSGSVWRRLLALAGSQRRLRARLADLARRAEDDGLSADQIERLLALARQAHRAALLSAHYEELRAALASWRFFHRWVALLMVILASIHIVAALKYVR